MVWKFSTHQYQHLITMLRSHMIVFHFLTFAAIHSTMNVFVNWSLKTHSVMDLEIEKVHYVFNKLQSSAMCDSGSKTNP